MMPSKGAVRMGMAVSRCRPWHHGGLSANRERRNSQGARMEKQVRAALQAWADHVWAITGQGATVGNVVQLHA
jgi:uncharacterized protein YcbX